MEDKKEPMQRQVRKRLEERSKRNVVTNKNFDEFMKKK